MKRVYCALIFIWNEDWVLVIAPVRTLGNMKMHDFKYGLKNKNPGFIFRWVIQLPTSTCAQKLSSRAEKRKYIIPIVTDRIHPLFIIWVSLARFNMWTTVRFPTKIITKAIFLSDLFVVMRGKNNKNIFFHKKIQF